MVLQIPIVKYTQKVNACLKMALKAVITECK